jgi:hypothetical protein
MPKDKKSFEKDLVKYKGFENTIMLSNNINDYLSEKYPFW